MSLQIENNFSSLCIKASKLSGIGEVNSVNYSWAKNPYDEWFSRVFNINVLHGIENSELNKIKENIEKGIIPDTLLIKEEILNHDLKRALNKNAFTEMCEQTTMSFDLSHNDFLDEDFHNVKIIDQNDDFQNWFKAVKNVFGEKNIKLFELFLKDNEIIFFGAYFNGKIVSTTMMFIHKGIAGLHLVGTAHKYRGKGFGTILTKYALKCAKEKGCKYCVLQASEMGKRIYKNIGFKEFDKISHWKSI